MSTAYHWCHWCQLVSNGVIGTTVKKVSLVPQPVRGGTMTPNPALTLPLAFPNCSTHDLYPPSQPASQTVPGIRAYRNAALRSRLADRFGLYGCILSRGASEPIASPAVLSLWLTLWTIRGVIHRAKAGSPSRLESVRLSKSGGRWI